MHINKILSLETLVKVSEEYHAMCRVFRHEYKWSCQEVDNISFRRLMRVFNETIEDAERRKKEIDSANG